MNKVVEFSFSDIVWQMLADWKYLGLSTFAGFMVAFGLGYLLTPTFTATMVVAKNHEKLDKTMFGGGSPLGLSFSGFERDSGEAGLFFEMLRSYSVARKIWEDDELVQHIFPGRWDQDNETWLPPYSSAVGKVKKVVLGKPAVSIKKPTPAEIVRFLRRNVAIYFQRKEGFWIVEYTDKNREMALRLLGTASDAADLHLRTVRVRQLSAQKEYLERLLANITLQEYRQTILSLMEEVDRKLMLSIPGQPYLVRIIEGPDAPVIPQRDKFLVILLAGIIVGAFGRIAVVIFRGSGNTD